MSQGNVYCTGPGGTWVYAPDGTHIGTIKTPEVPANLAFGGPDMKTLFFTAHTSVYSMRVKVPGLPGHPFKKRLIAQRASAGINRRFPSSFRSER